MTAEPADVRVSSCDGADLPEALILGVQREASKAGPKPGRALFGKAARCSQRVQEAYESMYSGSRRNQVGQSTRGERPIVGTNHGRAEYEFL